MEKIGERVENMTLWEATGIACALGLAGAAAYAWRVGVFTKMKLEKVKREPMLVMVKSIQCNVTELGSKYEHIISDVNKALPAARDSHLPIGIYYDSPSDLEDANHLRVDIGILLTKPIDENTMEEAAAELGMKVITIPEGEWVQGTWKFVNQLSFAIGPMKFYPGATAIAKNESKVHDSWTGSLEINHMHGKGSCHPSYTEYLYPLSQVVQITDIPVPRRKSDTAKTKNQ
mmetsp:Transcript_19988/g.39263  ORF Transcript_19988/g.39263 Transcript_19988/m.39263 type:complete len:231 (-) Transcript_19988:76-768(-)